ncbi:MAG: hypothetical protein ACLQVJ_15205 [Syntrophobacteraceae bacterium]
MESNVRFWRQAQVIGWITGIGLFIYCFFSNWWTLIPAALSMGFSAFAYSRVRAQEQLVRKIDSAILDVQTATYARLRDKYAKHRLPGLIAGAVVNELFSNESPTDEGRQFAQKHAKLIREKISELKEDIRLRTVMTQTLRVKAAFEAGLQLRSPEEAMRPLERLSELGILIPGGESPTLDTFLMLVRDYCREHGLE